MQVEAEPRLLPLPADVVLKRQAHKVGAREEHCRRLKRRRPESGRKPRDETRFGGGVELLAASHTRPSRCCLSFTTALRVLFWLV